MRRPWMTLGCAALVLGACSLASCSGSNETDLSAPNAGGAIDAGTGGADASAGTGGASDGGSGGEGGTAGATSTGGAGGAGGSDGGAGGVAGTAGQAGVGGDGGTATGGSAGTGGGAGDGGAGTGGGAGDGGASGSGGSGGTAGSGGSAGFGGASGSGGSGGDGGAGGSGGSAGAGGAGGTAGSGGAGGSGGTGGTAGSGGAGGSGGTGGTSGAGGSGGSTDGGPTVCLSTKDCPATQYCAKQGCNAVSGSCVDRPSMCNNNESPVCGCDGINYWNDCLRQLDGLEASTAGRCNSPTAKHCGGIGQLGCGVPWATCAYLFPNKSSCGMMDPMGVCWALPDTCPAIVIGGNQRSCSDANGACLDRCKAIKSGGMYYDDNTCPQ